MRIFSLIIFLLSCIGYYFFTCRKTDIKKEFIPIILISTIGLIEYLAGILNFMLAVTYIVGAIGVILFFHEIYLIIKKKEKVKIDLNLIIFLLLLCLCAYILKGVILTGYDDFSHWGLIIKNMLNYDKLPNFTTKTIIFCSYPPGTASYIYYVCKFLGTSESIMLFAQSVLIISSIYTIFAFCNNNRKINWIICILSVAYVLLANIFINQLLVDTVLPVMGIAALAIIEYYKKDSKRGLIYSLPVLSLLMLVKNSGIFFIIIDLIVWLIYFIKNNGIKHLFKTKYVLLILILVLLQCTWKGHIGIAFDGAENSKHSMSISNFINNVNKKEAQDIDGIYNEFIDRTFSYKRLENKTLLILIIGMTLTTIASYKNKPLMKKMLCYDLLFICSYITYQISLFAMYIFSMPLAEAKDLSSFGRYYKTSVIFLFGIFIIAVLYFINNYDFKRKLTGAIMKLIIIASIITITLYAPNKVNLLYEKQSVNNTIKYRYKILNLKKKNNIEQEKSYLVYIGNDEKNEINEISCLGYILEYEFLSNNVKIIKQLSDLKDNNAILNYDYFIILNESEEINNIIEEQDFGGKVNVIRSE